MKVQSISPVIQLAQTLISRPSITPQDGDCQKLIADRLAEIGFHYECFSTAGVTNSWIRRGENAPLFVFAGHTDVVPTGPLDKWHSPPFDPQIRDGFLYGRGASDMKTGIAAMVIAVERFISTHPLFAGSIAFLLTSDEEAKAIYGTRYVMEQLRQRDETIQYCIVGEPSSHQVVGDQVRVGRRGSLHGQLIIYGKQGHVAHPQQAENPIHRCVQALHELAHTTWDKGNADFPPTTFQLTHLQSGAGATNIIPGQLEARFNLRFGTAITIDEIKSRIVSLLTQHQLKFDLNWEVGAEPFLTPKGKLIEAVQQAVKQIKGVSPTLSTGGGTSDGRFIAPTGAELVELGVIHTTAHQLNECIALKDLEILVEIYYELLRQIFIS